MKLNNKKFKGKFFKTHLTPPLLAVYTLIMASLVTAPRGGESLSPESYLKIKPRKDNQVVVHLNHPGSLGELKMYDYEGDGLLDKIYSVTGGLPRGFIPSEIFPEEKGFGHYQKWYEKLYVPARQKVKSQGFDIYEGIF